MGQSIDEAIQTDENWDGHYAGATSDAAISAARRAFWVPTVNAGLQWEIHHDGWDVEVEIDGEGKVEVYLYNKERKVEFWSGD